MNENKFWLCLWTMVAVTICFITYRASQPDPAKVEAVKRWTPQEVHCVYGNFAYSADQARYCAELPKRDIKEILGLQEKL